MSKIRVAIVGGHDKDFTNVDWPKEYKFKHYPSGHNGGDGVVNKLINSIKNGGIDIVVFITKWLDHDTYYTVKQYTGYKIIPWHKSCNELSKNFSTIINS